MNQARKVAEELRPDSGWFHDPTTTEEIELSIQSLFDLGISRHEAKEIVGHIISAIRNEYGE